jgi:hypothetical protein
MKLFSKIIPFIFFSAAAVVSAKETFTESFGVDKAELTSVGTNRFFVLAPGFQAVYTGTEAGKPTVLTITVLPETRLIDGVATRVVLENETAEGQVAEISTNYFAFCPRTSDVFYFGEDTAEFKDGKVTSTAGTWHSGEQGAHFGLAMPGSPLLGARYYQEVAPKVAMDRAEVKSLTEKSETPAGTFADCLLTDETSATESGHEAKLYAPGIGLVQDAGLKLTKYGFIAQ